MSKVVYQKRTIVPANPGFYIVETSYGDDGPTALADVPVIAWSLHLEVLDNDEEFTKVTPITSQVSTDDRTPILSPNGVVTDGSDIWESVESYGCYLKNRWAEEQKFEAFILSNFDLGNESKCPCGELHGPYADWCREQNYEPELHKLRVALDVHFGIKPDKQNGEWFYMGLKAKSND